MEETRQDRFSIERFKNEYIFMTSLSINLDFDYFWAYDSILAMNPKQVNVINYISDKDCGWFTVKYERIYPGVHWPLYWVSNFSTCWGCQIRKIIAGVKSRTIYYGLNDEILV